MAATERPSTPRLGGGRIQVQASASSRQTITSTTTAPQQAVLRLRGAVGEAEQADGPADGEGTSARRRVQWAEDVVNNEGLGRKKSKVCCIYHAPKGIDESSDESSSDSDDSDSGDDGSARPTRRAGKGNGGPGHNHGHDHGKGKSRKRSPNAYEKMPKPKHGGPAR